MGGGSVRGSRCLAATLVGVVAIGGCASRGSFSVELTLRFDDGVTDEALAQVRSLSVASSGDEVAVYPISLDRPANRVERLVYRPSTGTHTLSIEAIAFSIDPSTQASSIIAIGASGTMQLDGKHSSSVELVLTAPTPSPVDLATPTDGPGDDLLGADAGPVDMAAQCPPGQLYRGGMCLPPPVAHFAFDEGSGTVAKDSSANGNDGTLLHGPLWVPGKVGPFALSFDGVDDHVEIGDPASGALDFGESSFTVAVWVYATSSTSPFDMPWIKGGASNGNPGYDFELGTDTWTVNLNDGIGAVQGIFCNETLNQWMRLVAVVDRTTLELRVYTNGMLVDAHDISALGSLSGAALAEMGAAEDSAWPFRGLIDDLIIFGVALTPTQVAALN